MGARQILAFLAMSLSLAGCASPLDLPGYPLYADPGHRLTRAETARLYGPMAWVDDRDVSGLGDALELMPGCHRVLTRNDPVPGIGGRTRTGSSYFGAQSFVVSMKPAHAYVLRRLASPGSWSVFLEEHDATGGWSRDVRPGRGDMGVCESVMIALHERELGLPAR